ncbi:MAG: ASCH domain-containing protein [Pseudomonadota bacterium]
MQFTKKLREPIKQGEITTSIRIWKHPHVKVGGRYKLDGGYITVTTIYEISLNDVTEKMAKESGFDSLMDLLKTAKHGSGSLVYFIKFTYNDA